MVTDSLPPGAHAPIHEDRLTSWKRSRPVPPKQVHPSPSSAASFASADMPTNYVGVTTVEDTDFFYQGPGTNYDFVQGKNQVTAGTKVAIYSITADGKWCYIGFSLYMGFIQTSSLNDLVTLRNGTTASIKATLAKSGIASSGNSGNVTVGPTGSTTTTTTTTGVIYNCTNWVSLRAEASSSSKRIAKLTPNTTVTVTGEQNGYYKVTAGNYIGFVLKTYVRITGTTATPAPGGTNNGSSGQTYVPGVGWVNSNNNSNANTNPNWSTGWGNNNNNNNNNTGWNTGNNNNNSGSNNSGSSATATTGTTTGNVNFRQGPGTGYSKVSGCAKVPKGSTVTILEQTNGWYKVTYKSYTGYLSADYVRVVGGGASAPGSAGSTGGVNTPGSTGNNVGSVSSNGTKYAKYTGTSADIWGSMSVAGTNINDNIYCNAVNNKGQFVYNAYSSSKNNLYALSYLTDPIAVIYGHNMRKVAKKQTTNLGLHELHHVQNAWLGKAKCEYCGRSCSGAKTSTFNINYNGSSSWTLVGFFEISNSTMSSAAQRKKIQTYASFNSTLTGSAKQQWVDTMMSYCNSKYLGATLGSISGSDKVMVIITCADKSGSKNQSMYMILKGN